jgi:ubiquinone/menaquinone biosynthesis C-methylase UbiE
VEHHGHKQFPEGQAFILNNPIRRLLSPPKRLISKINIDSHDVVVDFGCGPGFFLLPLAKVARRAIGVDVSPRMLEKAAEHAKKELSAIELLQSDGTNLRLDNGSVDLILLNHVFHEVQDKTRVLGEFHRILKPLGRLAIVERTREVSRLRAKFGPPKIDEKELANDVQQKGFKIIESIPHGTDSIVIAQKANTLN